MIDRENSRVWHGRILVEQTCADDFQAGDGSVQAK
jgi:hypothetical protein